MEVNFKGTVQATSNFVDLLKKSKNKPTVVVLGSILGKVPNHDLPIYSASKAAIHSFCISFRAKQTSINMLEVLPPLVNTPMTESFVSNDKMSPDDVAKSIVNGILKGKEEVYPGQAKLANLMSKVYFKKISNIINAS